MIKSISFEQAERIEKEEYGRGKERRSISICNKLHNAYKEFCFNNMKKQDMSYRIRILMVRDMLENKR